MPGKPATACIYLADVLLHVKNLLNKWDILNTFLSNTVFGFLGILICVQFQTVHYLP